jgi:cytochrome c-type biogenesis protein
MDTVSIVTAFFAGLLSFLAPCVLPIIPGFLAYISGVSFSNIASKRKEVFAHSVFFVLGFSVVFALLGVLLNSVLRSATVEIRPWLSRIGGVLIIFFGLYLLGLIKIPLLETEHKMRLSAKGNGIIRYGSSFLFGAAFAVGWTPCVGPALGAILGLAASSPGSALYLLIAYSLGIGLPFLVVGFFTGEASAFINRYAGIVKYIQMVFGALLIALGVLVFTDELPLIANFGFINNLLLH